MKAYDDLETRSADARAASLAEAPGSLPRDGIVIEDRRKYD